MNNLKVVGRKGVEPLSTRSEPIVLTITLPTENPATFTSGRVEIRYAIKNIYNMLNYNK